MSSIGNILSLANKLHGLPTNHLIATLTEELRGILESPALDFNKSAHEKLHMLTALLKHETESHSDPLPENIVLKSPSGTNLHTLWILVMEKYFTIPDCSPHDVIQFLVSSLPHFTRTEMNRCSEVIQSRFHLSIESLAEGGTKSAKESLICALNLMEALLTPDALDGAASTLQQSIFFLLSNAIIEADETLVDSSYYLRMVGLFSSSLSKFKHEEFTNIMWRKIFNAFMVKGDSVLKIKVEDTDSVEQRCLVLLDLLLEFIQMEVVIQGVKDPPKSKTKTLLSLPVTWVVIQRGLKNTKPLVRKQAVFDLRKALSIVALGNSNELIMAKLESSGESSTKNINVASSGQCSVPIVAWNNQNKEVHDFFWSNFLLVVETLEENQLHVIAPVIKKLDGLISMTSNRENRIHTSWVCVLLQRMISHESKAIIREGVVITMGLDATGFPFLHQDFSEEFLYNGCKGGLFLALQDVNLFCDHRDTTLSQTQNAELPVVAVLIQEFMQKCLSGHPNTKAFLSFIIHSTEKINWGSVPLYYFCRALSMLPKHEAWSTNELKSFQSVMARCSRTHDVRLRHVIQNCLLRCMIQFTKCSEVTTDEVLNIIALCTGKTFFKDVGHLWSQISLWMYQSFTLFSNVSNEEGESICLYSLRSLERYCASTSQQLEDFSCKEIRKESSTHALLVLMVDQALFQKKDQAGEDFLKQIFLWLGDITEKASTHLYMPKEKIFKSIAILDHLVTAWTELWNSSTKQCGVFYNDLFKILRNVLSYAVMRFSSGSGSMSEAKFCLDTWRNLFSYLTVLDPKCQWPHQLAKEFTPLLSVCHQIFSAKGETSWRATLTSVFCLSWMCDLVQDFRITLDHSSSKYIGEFLASLDLSGELMSSAKSDGFLGREKEQYNAIMWSCVPFVLQLQKQEKSKELLDCVAGLQRFLNQLDTVTEYNLPTYIRAVEALLPEVLKLSDDHQDLVCRCLDTLWKSVDDLSRSPYFWKSYRSFVTAVFQRATLSLSHRFPQIQEKVSDLLQKIALLSTSKPGLIKYACKACLSSWTECSVRLKRVAPSSSVELSDEYSSISAPAKCIVHSEYVMFHTSFVVQCLTFSIVHEREDLALQNVLRLVDQENGTNAVLLLPQGDDHIVSLSTIAMLLQLDSKSARDCKVCSTIVQKLLNLDIAISKKKPRYHHNSIHHHIKNKIFQSVILLLPYISSNDAESLIKFLITGLKNNTQPSVRYFMEWTLSLLFHRFASFEDLLLKQLTACESDDALSESDVGVAKFSAICSFLTVALFVGLGKEENQEQYFLSLVNVCLPWCMSQHFSIRLYALAVILRIKMYFDDRGKVDFIWEKHPALQSCLQFADTATGNVGRNWKKNKDNFFIFDFHPIDDLSLETVYVSIPRLCGLEGHITIQDLSFVVGGPDETREKISRIGVPTFNVCDKLRLKPNTKWIPQDSKQGADIFVAQDMRYRKNYGAEDLTVELSNLGNGVDNVQKKIMPWLDMVDSVSKESLVKNRPKGLILVASLIDKPSNLGGLTRTCEIFGVEALVVGSLSCTSDKVYQSLSVTAQKWLSMKEVKPRLLEEYLNEMRKEGYTLVGTEQTAQSVCLSKYKFPEKCVVVLGNEKEGIPISLLKILDVCVQIPQRGIIRSLNVHVSGAIAVWEYARQHLSRAKDW